VAQPEKIVMFGSAARGEMGPHSDVDLLVVRSGAHRRKLAMAIYKHLSGVGCPVDVIVVTPEDIERYGSSPVLIINPASAPCPADLNPRSAPARRPKFPLDA